MCLIVFCNAVFSQSTSKICTLIRFTLFSNSEVDRAREPIVLLPYRFTLFSNPTRGTAKKAAFYYLIDLHYSQTLCVDYENKTLFYYLIDLHYSQTAVHIRRLATSFYYLIDLHYSQTSNLKLGIKCTHYTVHGKSIRLFYNICIMIVNKIRTNHYQSQQGVPCCNPAWMFS